MRDPGGKLLGVLGIARDVTQARAVAESLRQSEEHYRALAETTFDWIWEVDAAARYTFVSPRVVQLLGYAPDEVLGRTPFELMPAEEADRVSELYEELAGHRAPSPISRTSTCTRTAASSCWKAAVCPISMRRRTCALSRHGPRHHGSQAGRAPIRHAGSGEPGADGGLVLLAEAAPRVLPAIGISETWSFGALWEWRGRVRNCATSTGGPIPG